MAEGGFDDYEDLEMNDLGKYTDKQIDDELEGVTREYNSLNDEYIDGGMPDNERVEMGELTERLYRLGDEQERRGLEKETSFIDSNDGSTVTIRGTNVKIPSIDFGLPSVSTPSNPENEVKPSVERFISDMTGKKFRLNEKDSDVLKLRLRTSMTVNNNVLFRPIMDNNRPGKEQIVLKRGKGGALQYNTAKVSQKSVGQFRELVQRVIDNARDREDTARSMPLLDAREIEYVDIPGLTPNENRELRGVVNPSDRSLPESRVGDSGALQAQANHFDETIEHTNERIAELSEIHTTISETEEYIDLQERVVGLTQARDRTLAQREIEEVREQQEVDIDTLQKFKKWAKENMVGLSALAITVAGIITTIVIAGRSAVVKGARATKSFAQAAKDAIAKMGPWAVGLANLVYNVLKLGAKGLAWLAQNLWVLAVVFAWFAYDYYKLKR